MATDKDKEAQYEYGEARKKRDAQSRSSSAYEKERLGKEIEGHVERAKVLVGEWEVLDRQIKALVS